MLTYRKDETNGLPPATISLHQQNSRKTLLFIWSRHSHKIFVCTVALGNGISIESIAQMLGHSTTKITHQYARVSDTKVANEMERIKRNF